MRGQLALPHRLHCGNLATAQKCHRLEREACQTTSMVTGHNGCSISLKETRRLWPPRTLSQSQVFLLSFVSFKHLSMRQAQQQHEAYSHAGAACGYLAPWGIIPFGWRWASAFHRVSMDAMCQAFLLALAAPPYLGHTLVPFIAENRHLKVFK